MQPLLGTWVRIEVYAAVEEEVTALYAAMTQAFQVMESIQKQLSFHAADNLLAEINQFAAQRWIVLPDDIYSLLLRAQQFSVESQGVFDLTVGARLVLAGQRPLPAWANKQMAKEAAQSDYRALLLQDSSVYFTHPTWLDLGGIAKGWAVDAAVAVLQAAGITAACVNAGGDLRVWGGVILPVCLHPALASRLIQVADCALASSASRQAEDFLMGEILPPLSADFAPLSYAVSVSAANTADADALTKIIAMTGDIDTAFLMRYQAKVCYIARQFAV